jgi:XTP/dITP diphosphohydrolase
MIELLVATTNQHKLDEIEAILSPMGVRVLSLDSVTLKSGQPATDLPEPIEDADTFAGNAQIKAVYYAKAIGMPCLADDSGLEVDALNGAPGVHSARYAGIGSNRNDRDAANNAKLLRALAEVPLAQRTARFVCAMCLASPTGQTLATSQGVFAGVITDSPRGGNGFGYDPLLELPDGRTSAELSPEEKNTRSHRGAAVRALADQLPQCLQQ